MQNTLSLKMVEIPLQKFNEEAIPHHLNLLKQHKSNITKYQENGELNKIKNEQLNAKRQVTQLKTLLREMEDLRNKLNPLDLAKFDALTQKSRKKTLQAIVEYLDNPPAIEFPKTLEPNIPCSLQSTASSDSIGTLLPPNVQLIIDKNDLQLQEKEDCLRSYEELNNEVHDLYEIFTKFQQAVDDQRQPVNELSSHIEVTAVNVSEGRRHLSLAEKYKMAAYPIAGAVVGGCIAGPIGLIAGAKVAGAALLGGGLLGFTGATLLKRKRDEEIEKSEVTTEMADKKCL